MPQPLSTTRICLTPPSASATPISVAPESRLFSRSSLSTEAGRSTTSPAAIWLISASGSRRMAGTVSIRIEDASDAAIICDTVECRGGSAHFRLGLSGSSRPAPRRAASAVRRLDLRDPLRHYFFRDGVRGDAVSPRGLPAVRRRRARRDRGDGRAPARADAGRSGGARQYGELLDRLLPRPQGVPVGGIAVLQPQGARPRP